MRTAAAFIFWEFLFLGNYLSRTFLLLNLSILRTFRQRGTPKGKKGEELIKPDKNRHFLPLFPLRFPPLDSPFLNPFFPLYCRFLPASFPATQDGADPYQPVAGNYSGAWLSTETGSFPLYIRKCFTESRYCCPENNIHEKPSKKTAALMQDGNNLFSC